jgi:hypothetical protein
LLAKLAKTGQKKGQNLPKPGPRTDIETTGARNHRQISRHISTVSISTSTGNFRKKMGDSLGDPKQLVEAHHALLVTPTDAPSAQ